MKKQEEKTRKKLRKAREANAASMAMLTSEVQGEELTGKPEKVLQDALKK